MHTLAHPLGHPALLVMLFLASSVVAHAQGDPRSPWCVELPVMGRLTGTITQPVVRGTAEEFGRSVMPLFAQQGGLPGMMIQRIKADTIAREDYSLESYFYKGVQGRLPDSSNRMRIGLSEIGSEARLLCAGDWDADGYRDLAMWLRVYRDSTYGGWDYNVGRVVIFWGNDREEYTLGDTSRLIATTEQWGGAHNAFSHDFDQDGTADLLVRGGGGMQQGNTVRTAQLHIFKGYPGRRWGRGGAVRTADWAMWNIAGTTHVALVDQDSDGAADIVFHIDDDGRTGFVTVIYGRPGALPDTSDIEVADLAVANGHYSILSDVTGDGAPELLVNTGSTGLIRIYAGSRGQRIRDQYGSGYEGPTPGKGFWRRPWAEIWLPNMINPDWRRAGFEALLDLGDANGDGINDIWIYCKPSLICYAGGRHLDSLIDAIVTVPSTQFISAANVGDITGTGREALAIGYDQIPHEWVDPFPGGVLFVRTDTAFVVRGYERLLPHATDAVVGAVPGLKQKQSLTVAPNPVYDVTTLHWTGLIMEGQARLSVVNALGIEVYDAVVEARDGRVDLEIQHLSPGRYQVFLTTPESILSAPLIRF